MNRTAILAADDVFFAERSVEYVERHVAPSRVSGPTAYRAGMSNPLIVVRDVSKTFPGPTGPFNALTSVNLSIDEGEFVVVVGQSGSGKSTLLALLAGIDRPTQGEVMVGGTAVHSLSERQMSAWLGWYNRRRRTAPYEMHLHSPPGQAQSRGNQQKEIWSRTSYNDLNTS